MNHHILVCQICCSPVKMTKTHVRFICMCDDEIRVLPLEVIDTEEHRNKFAIVLNDTTKTNGRYN